MIHSYCHRCTRKCEPLITLSITPCIRPLPCRALNNPLARSLFASPVKSIVRQRPLFDENSPRSPVSARCSAMRRSSSTERRDMPVAKQRPERFTVMRRSSFVILSVSNSFRQALRNEQFSEILRFDVNRAENLLGILVSSRLKVIGHHTHGLANGVLAQELPRLKQVGNVVKLPFDHPLKVRCPWRSY